MLIEIDEDENHKKVKKIILEAGELIIIPAGIIHRFKALEKSTIIDMISESRMGNSFEDDVVRITIHE